MCGAILWQGPPLFLAQAASLVYTMVINNYLGALGGTFAILAVCRLVIAFAAPISAFFIGDDPALAELTATHFLPLLVCVPFGFIAQADSAYFLVVGQERLSIVLGICRYLSRSSRSSPPSKASQAFGGRSRPPTCWLPRLPCLNADASSFRARTSPARLATRASRRYDPPDSK